MDAPVRKWIIAVVQARTRLRLASSSLALLPDAGHMDPAVAALGLTGLTPHGLRHTAASLAVAAGANVKVVQQMLGHASAAMTLDVYAGLFGDDLDAVADRLDAAARRAAADFLRTSAPTGPESPDGDSPAAPPLTCEDTRWGGWGSNPRPRDYESLALTG